MKLVTRLIFGILLLIFVCIELFEMQTVEINFMGKNRATQSMTLPRKDKKRLEYFFRNTVLHNDYGYTLLGEKPVSLAVYQRFPSAFNWIHIYSALLPQNIKMRLGWNTWKKYEHQFKLTHFMLWEEESPWIENGVVILLANREILSKTYERFKDDFHRLGTYVDLSQVDSNPLLKKQLKSHEALIGIILGYGRENAWLFHSSSQQQKRELPPLWEQEIKEGLLNQFQGKTIAEQLGYPQFIAHLTSDETKMLKEDYRQVREMILQTYEGKDFLETTLTCISQTFPENLELRFSR